MNSVLLESAMNRIFLSKPAVVTCAGLDSRQLWNSVVNGNQDGIKKVTAVSGDSFHAGKIDDVMITPTTARFDMRILRIEEMALEQIGCEIELAKNKFGAGRVAVCVGSCDNGTKYSVAGHEIYFSKEAFADDYSIEVQGADYPATFIREKFSLEGPCLSFSTACSSSAAAIIKGAQLLNSGLADAVVAGGVDIASDTVLLGFSSLEAVSDEITNPFSKNRKGITLGEGAAFFVMTRERLFEGNVQLLGYGECCDAHHMTSPDPEGKGARKAMEEALENAGLEASDIDYLNLHGTGTKLNDSMESKAVAAVFGNHKVPVSTTKPYTGHTLGAGSAVELAICYEAIENNRGKESSLLPLQKWDGQRDPELPELNFVDESNRDGFGKIRICMSNSFAFGGANACLIVGEK